MSLDDLIRVKTRHRHLREHPIAGPSKTLYRANDEGVLVQEASGAVGCLRVDAERFARFDGFQILRPPGEAIPPAPPPRGTPPASGDPDTPGSPADGGSESPDAPSLPADADLTLTEWLKLAAKEGIQLSASEKRIRDKTRLVKLIRERAASKKD